jgi:hypothetical protein
MTLKLTLTRTTVFAAILLSATSASAEQSPSAPAQGTPATEAAPTPAATSTESGLEALAEEIRRLKLELGLPGTEYKSFAGLGPAASKVYYAKSGLSIGGYGEIFLAEPAFQKSGDTRRATTDLLRFVVYAGYRFSDRIVLNSEIEYEHANTEKGGAVEVEFAYLDFKLSNALSLRIGNLLMPIGFINEIHEPPFFHGVQRPELERNLIPTTWNENGVGVYGGVGKLRYKLYGVNGLQAIGNRRCVTDTKGTSTTSDDVTLCDTGNDGIRQASWIRGARPRGARALAESFAGVLNVGWFDDLFEVAGSVYGGRSGQGERIGGMDVNGDVMLAEVHAGVSWRGLQARALVAYGTLSDGALIAQVQGPVAERVQGGYAEVAYDLMRLTRWSGEQRLSPFVRFERFDLGKELAGGVANGSLKVTNVTAGATYKPIETVALKADYTSRSTEQQGTRAQGTFNFGMGFVF